MVNDNTITFDSARILFRNFEGKEGTYNRQGDRNFCVAIPEELVEPLRADGWNVKFLAPKREDDTGLYYMKVSVSYKGRPPMIALISSRGRTNLDSDQVPMLDWVDIKNVDLIVRPYKWDIRGETGTSAYLKTMFITINEDELELRYADVREISDREEFIDAEVVDELEHPRRRAIEGRR